MGQFRFLVPVEWDLDSYHANVIHMVGLDGIPCPCRIEVKDPMDGLATEKTLTVIRNSEESGRVYVIYPFVERGEMMVCTGTLPVREQPYDLLTELARGTLNRLRNQISIWEEGGLSADARIGVLVTDSIERLAQAIHCADSGRREEFSRASLEISIAAMFELAETFGVQVSKFRRENTAFSTFWLANGVGSGGQFSESISHELFDLVEVGETVSVGNPRSGDVLALAKEHGKRVILGPWLDASAGGLSTMLEGASDYQECKRQLLIECRQQLESLHPTTSLLHVVSGLNGIGHRQLSYPQQLQFTVDLLRLVEEALVEVPAMVSFDFPWGERLVGAVGAVHPLQIADSLLRQGVQISFLGLDINLDYWPNGSMVRDPMQWIDLVDVWAQLGLPLVLCLRAPSGEGGIPGASTPTRGTNQMKSNLTDEQRIDFLTTVLPMMVARPSIHGMIWRQWQDQDDDRYPRGGLVDVNGVIKPMGEALAQMKTAAGG